MKIKTKKLSYDKVAAIKKPKHKKPLRPLFILRLIIRILAIFDLKKVHFKFEGSINKKEPALILMNHSSFIDLKIAHRLLFPMPFGIVCTSDGFVGKSLLMRLLGCIPTKKFVSDIGLISDMKYLLSRGVSVLMYPEASYSFDGTATPLPRRLGILLKKLNVPVVYIETDGAFLLDPLYNGLRIRKCNVSAKISTLVTKEDIKEKSVDELDRILDEAFSFDNFKSQRDKNHRGFQSHRS